MNPDIWGELPWDLIERIAHFTDIDSRRALGFLPRRLIVPQLNIHTPRQKYPSQCLLNVQFEPGIELNIWPVKWLSYETKWMIHGRFYSTLFNSDGTVKIIEIGI
jgi:hypothetical protein